MQTSTRTLISLLALSVSAFGQAMFFGSNYPTGSPWQNARPIDVDQTKVPSSQSNFVLTVDGTYAFMASVGNGGELNSAYDFAPFTDAHCTTRIAGMFTKLAPDSTTGAVVLEIGPVTVTSGAGTVTVGYLCTGNLSISSTQDNASALWPTEVKLVAELGNGSSLSVADITSNANNGTNHGATATTGQNDGGAALNGTNQYIDIASASTLNLTQTDSFSFQVWYNDSSFAATQTIFEKLDDPTTYRGYTMEATAGTPGTINVLLINDYTGANYLSRGCFVTSVDSSNHLLTITYDGTATAAGVKMYQDDAVLVACFTTLDALSATMSNSVAANIGRRRTSNNQYFAGTLSGLRFYKGLALSADRIATDYNNQFSPSTFYAFGSRVTP